MEERTCESCDLSLMYDEEVLCEFCEENLEDDYGNTMHKM